MVAAFSAWANSSGLMKASGATEMKQNAEGDTTRMAKAVAKQITKDLASQGWAK